MRVIIAGSRSIVCSEYIFEVLDKLAKTLNFEQVVSGGAKGPDSIGAKWARAHKIPVEEFIPDWKRLGKKAGIFRNIEMVENSDGLIAFWDGQSKGTKHTIDIALKSPDLRFVLVYKPKV